MQVRLSASIDASDAFPESVTLALAHPTRALGDRRATLVRGADGRYRGRIDARESERWRVTVETPVWQLAAADVEGSLRAIVLTRSRRAN